MTENRGGSGRSSVVAVAADSSCSSSSTTTASSSSIVGTQQQQQQQHHHHHHQQPQLLSSSSSSSSLNNMIHGMMTNLDFLSCTSIQNINRSSTTETTAVGKNHSPIINSAITSGLTVPSLWTRMATNQASAATRIKGQTENEQDDFLDDGGDGIEIDEIVENLHLQAYQLQRV